MRLGRRVRVCQSCRLSELGRRAQQVEEAPLPAQRRLVRRVVPAAAVRQEALDGAQPNAGQAPAAGLRALQYTQISAVSQERALRKDPAAPLLTFAALAFLIEGIPNRGDTDF